MAIRWGEVSVETTNDSFALRGFRRDDERQLRVALRGDIFTLPKQEAFSSVSAQ